jgi:hypothetical protein
VDPCVDNNASIYQASRLGHRDVVRLLLNDPRVDPTARDYRALREASESVIELILSRIAEDHQRNMKS